MKRIGIVLSLVMALTNPVIAQSEAGAIFLLIAPGARAGGMGEAQVAVANDAYASYWNPAGLTNISDYQGSLMHAEYFEGIAITLTLLCISLFILEVSFGPNDRIGLLA